MTTMEQAPFSFTLEKRRNPALQFIGRLFREKPFGAVAGVCSCCSFLPACCRRPAPYGFNEISPIERLKPPSWRHLFGTDNLGRDLFSRCLFGARLSVIIGFSAAFLATVISVLIGTLTGYIGGRFDLVGQRFVDA